MLESLQRLVRNSFHPHRLDITPFIRNGNNHIEVELTDSNRNLMGPHHRANGEPDDCWRTAFNYTPPGGSPPEHAEDLEGAWTGDYFVVHFGLRGRARIRYLSCRAA